MTGTWVGEVSTSPAERLRLAKTIFEADAASRLLGIEITEFGDNLARGRMTVTPATGTGRATAGRSSCSRTPSSRARATAGEWSR